MHITPALLLGCLQKVEAMMDCFRLNIHRDNGPFRSIDDLLTLYNHFDGRPTSLQELPIDYQSAGIWGMFVKQDDGTAIVAYVSGLSPEWRRFVICKELMHGLLDEDGYRDMDIATHVERMCLDFPDDDSQPPVTIQVEFLAEVAAMEFLFPYSSRTAVIERQLDKSVVATNFGVPLKLVETYCSPAYMTRLNKATITTL